jgi:hypothetical protein
MACILLLVVVIHHAATDSGDGCTAEVVEATRHIAQSLRTALDTSAQLQQMLTATLRENAELRLALNESQRRVSRLMNDSLMRTLPPAQVRALGRCYPNHGFARRSAIHLLLQAGVALALTAERSAAQAVAVGAIFDERAGASTKRHRAPSTQAARPVFVAGLRSLGLQLSLSQQVPMEFRKTTRVPAPLMA